MLMLTRLASLLSLRFGRSPVDPFEGYVDYRTEPPLTPWHVIMPARHRPILVSSHATFAEAVDSATVEAATFAAEGWFVSRAHDRLWQICGQDSNGEFMFTKLEIVTSDMLARAKDSHR